MAAKKKKKADPTVVVEGMEDVLEKDLAKHKGILERTKGELAAYRDGRAYEVRKKKHYRALINEGKYDRASMEAAIGQIDINLRHMADKVKLSNDKIEHEQEIVTALEEQLSSQYRDLKYLEEMRRDGAAN